MALELLDLPILQEAGRIISVPIVLSVLLVLVVVLCVWILFYRRRSVGDRGQQSEFSKKILDEGEQYYKSLFEYNPYPVFYLDLEGHFQGVNPRFEQFSGYLAEELVGQSITVFVDEKDLERTRSRIERAASGEYQEYETTGLQRDGSKRDLQISVFPIVVSERIVGIFGVIQDITEHKKHDKELKESELKWQYLVEDNPQPVQVTVDGEIVFLNDAGAKLYGAESPNKLLGKSIFDFSHPEQIQNIEERKYKLENNLPVERIHEHKIIRLNGEERIVEVHSIPVHFQGESGIQTVLHDVTDRREKEKIIEASLAEKEVLLKEIHHRVKNNLAVVTGLLELQSMNAENGEVKEVLKESQLRIHSMAMIHEKLYQTDTFTNIEFGDYIKELVRTISSTFHFPDKDITVQYKMDSVKLNINQSIPCALILNELIVNCYKHAFTKMDKGTIVISLKNEGDVLKLGVSDNGQGLPEGFAIDEQQSLGMTLIRTLTTQIRGNLTLCSDGRSSCFRISFRIS